MEAVECFGGRLQETPEAATARGQAVRWSAWGGGAVWLTLKVPLTLSPHWPHTAARYSSSRGNKRMINITVTEGLVYNDRTPHHQNTKVDRWLRRYTVGSVGLTVCFFFFPRLLQYTVNRV